MKRLSNLSPFVTLCLFTLLSAACSAAQPAVQQQATDVDMLSSDVSTQATSPQALEVAQQTATAPTVLVTSSAALEDIHEITLTPALKSSLQARVLADSLVLRSGPGSLFEAIDSYAADSRVSLSGKAAGGEWVKAETADHRSGWMLAIFLEIDGDPDTLPLEDTRDTLTLFGNIRDEDGLPIQSINLAVHPYQSNTTRERIDAFSDAEGKYYAYLPIDTRGTWTVEIVGYGCDSNIMNPDCEMAGHFEPERPINFDLPYPGPFDFTYVMP